MKKLLFVALALSVLLSGCVVYDRDGHRDRYYHHDYHGEYWHGGDYDRDHDHWRR